MRVIKKLSVMLCLMAVLLASTFPVEGRADETDYEVTQADNVDTDVVLSVDDTFTVKIPKRIVLDDTNKANDYLTNYNISVKGDIAAAKQIRVYLDAGTFVLTQDGKPDGAGAIDIDSDGNLSKTWVHTDINPDDYTGDGAGSATTTGAVTATGVTAGEYSGVVTFNIAFENIPVSP